MKVGARKPSAKKSISARTKGRATRTVKRATNPFYGKKGVGWIKNPQKAAYSKLYHATTFSVFSLFSSKRRKKKDGPIITAISNIIVLCIFAGILQSILPALGTILIYIIGIPLIGLVVYVCIMYFSSNLNGADTNEVATDNPPAENNTRRVIVEIPDDAKFYLGNHADNQWIIALGKDNATIINLETGEVTNYNRVPAVNNSFRLEQNNEHLDFIITENEDCLIMGMYDFDRVEKKDLEGIIEYIKK